MDIPKDLFEKIKKERIENKLETFKIEDCQKLHINCIQSNGKRLENRNNTFTMAFKNRITISRAVTFKLRKIMQEWSNVKLEKNGILSGIRRYTRGAKFSLHVDKIPTHFFGAILQIDQKVDEDWPLLVVDHQGNRVKIILKSGQMIIYEAGTIPHGRQFPLKGEYFDNLFMHFGPEDLNIYI